MRKLLTELPMHESTTFLGFNYHVIGRTKRIHLRYHYVRYEHDQSINVLELIQQVADSVTKAST
jgi:hypothetical protein